MKEYCVLIVLYKTEVETCPTICSLVQCKAHLNHSKIIFWDNSPGPVTVAQMDWLNGEFQNFYYTHTPSNISLSKIYNTVLAGHTDYKYLIILDQDSHFSSDYFTSIKSAVKEVGDVNLLVPAIFHGDVAMSPGYYYNFKGGYRDKIEYGLNSTKNMCVIASGMCISVSYLLNDFDGFNEAFTFYGIDTFFSTQYRKNNDNFYVLECFFCHSLSVNEVEPFETKLRRFNNHKASLLLLTANSSLFVKVKCRLYVFIQLLKFRLKHK